MARRSRARTRGNAGAEAPASGRSRHAGAEAPASGGSRRAGAEAPASGGSERAGAEAPASRRSGRAGAEAPASGRRRAAALTRALIAVGRRFYARHWVLGTSGNFSAVLSRRPFRLLLTASAAHKGTLRAGEFVVVGEDGRAVGRAARTPSAETRLHLAIVEARGAAAVLHTHSVWGTILSEHHAEARGLAIAGYEMLKGLDGILTHEHREWIPIIDNDQDMARLELAVRGALADHPAAHAFLLRGHGLYTWGASVADAERHIEILEFLFETVGRRSQPWP